MISDCRQVFLKIYHEPDNELVFRVAAEHPGRFYCWLFVNPAGKDDQVALYKKFRGFAGFAGVKAHPFWHRYSPEMLAPVAELAAADGKPLLLHAGFNGDGDFFSLKRSVPELKIILAHAGFPCYADTWKKIVRDKSIMMDFSSNHYVSRKAIMGSVKYLGVDRCMFGTDGPYGRRETDGTMNYGLIRHRIESMFHDTGVTKRILGENFLEVSGLR